MLTPTVAKGLQFGESNAVKPFASNLDVRHPRNSLKPKYTTTSGISKWPAMLIAPSKFWIPSFRGLHKGICDPVMQTVLSKFSNMKESAEAVHDIVSVPCKMTKESKSS